MLKIYKPIEDMLWNRELSDFPHQNLMIDQIESYAVVKQKNTYGRTSPIGGMSPSMQHMLIMAWVADDFGIPSNCEGFIFSNTAGATYLSTIKSSASFERIGVSEIGRRRLFMSRIGLSFGIGVTFAFFQALGSFYSW